MHATHNPPDSHPTPADTLRAAAKYLRRHGWIQHRYYADLHSPSPAACTLGALYIVTHGQPTAEPYVDVFDDTGHADAYIQFVNAEFTLSLFLGLHRSDRTGVHEWNDEPDRTAADVILALLNAAEDFNAGGAR
jgi:hypothetical protein